MTPREEPDIVVVGAGIIGLAVARELLRRDPDRTVSVLEREAVTGFHQTGHNSGVVHAGIYYTPGSLKAKLCTEGAPELLAYCAEHGIPARQDGKLIVAVDDGEIPRLDELERRGRANGVPGLKRLRPEELQEIEPHVRGVDALHSPATAVVDFQAVAQQFARDVEAAGGEVVTSCAVQGADLRANRLCVRHDRGESRAQLRRLLRRRLERPACGRGGRRPRPPHRPLPRRLAAPASPSVRTSCERSCTPCPTPTLPFLGVHFTRGADDEVLIGPTALLAGARDAYALRRLSGKDLRETLTWGGTYRMARRWWRTGAQGAPPRAERQGAGPGRRPLHPRADARRRAPRPCRRPRPGARPRR